MATRNLTPLRRMVERRMLDTGTLRRDTPGTDDDVLDLDTGVLTPPANDVATVYTGKCIVYPTALNQRIAEEGGRTYTNKTLTVRLPWDAPEPRVGDLFTVTSSQHDAVLVNLPLRVLQVDKSTFLISRDMIVEDRATP